jgi:hypothetical protein
LIGGLAYVRNLKELLIQYRLQAQSHLDPDAGTLSLFDHL